MISELDERVRALESLLANVVRIGVVVSTNPAAHTVRVAFGDRDNIVSSPLPVLVPKAHSDKFYRLPDVGEQVLCVFLPSGVEQGFAIGALYSRADATPAASQDRHIVQYADGTRTEYDRASHTITITIGDTAATLDREKVLLTAGGVQVLIDGTGLHTTGGGVTHNGINIGDTHVHGGVQVGSDNTGGPA
jgi:phage baseplate assembly protein V